MRHLSLYRVELRRLLLTKRIWLVAALSLLTPIIGYFSYSPSPSTAMSGRYIGNPVGAGTLFGAVLWAVIAVLEADRQHRSGTDVLAEATAPPISHSTAKAAALITLSSMTTALCSLAYLPYTAIKLDYLFDASFYFAHFAVYMLPTWWISILLAEALYRVTRRVELSALIYAALAYVCCFSRFAERRFLLWWLNPLVGLYSDGFPDIWYLRLGAYTRLMWLCVAAGVWVFSLICRRKYQRGLLGSFAKGLKKVYLPIVSVLLIAVGGMLWSAQPFIGHGGEEFLVEYDFLGGERRYEAMTGIKCSIKVDPLLGTLHGRMECMIPIALEGESAFRLNAGYRIERMTFGDEKVEFRTVKEDINGQYDTYFTLPKLRGRLVIEYGGLPTVAQCHMPDVHQSIGKNFFYLGSTDLIPLFRDYGLGDYSMKLDITIPEELTPFIYHEPLSDYVDNGDGTRTYSTKLDNTYVYNFVAGKYQTDCFSSEEGIDFRFVYGETYRSTVDEYDVRQSICDVFDYCTRHYGKPHYVLDGEEFTLFQFSALSRAGYAIEGISTWYEEAISPDTLGDPYRGANAVDVFIHEMIHQWWGGVGMWCEDDGLWSAEGLTVYSTYRLVKEKYGDLYARQYYVDDWQRYVDEQDRNFYNRHPEYLEKLPERYREQLSSLNTSVNRYKRMPLMILRAEELVGGEEKMDEILREMFAVYNEEGQHPVTFREFLDYCGLTEEALNLD